MSLYFEHANFTTPHSRVNVHGSWVRAAFWTLRTARTGRLLQVFYHSIDPRRCVVTEGCTPPYCNNPWGAHVNRWELNSTLSILKQENVEIEIRGRKVAVSTGRWMTTAESTVGRFTLTLTPHPIPLLCAPLRCVTVVLLGLIVVCEQATWDSCDHWLHTSTFSFIPAAPVPTLESCA